MTGWSRWVFVIVPGSCRRPPIGDIRLNAGRFARARFGPDTRLRIRTYADGSLSFELHATGCPVLEPRFVAIMTAAWRVWAEQGWGPGTDLQCALATISRAPVPDLVMCSTERIAR